MSIELTRLSITEYAGPQFENRAFLVLLRRSMLVMRVTLTGV
jgi:hypothetical protein